jgi:hypothetical protein
VTEQLIENAVVAVVSSHGATSTTVRVRPTTYYATGTPVAAVEDLPSIGYLQVEFPTGYWNFLNVVTAVTHSLEREFVERLPRDPRIEHVYWASEEEVLKVWTIIPEPDFGLESPVYDAQMAFMEKFPQYECDFSVIYRFGKPLSEIQPQGARLIL